MRELRRDPAAVDRNVGAVAHLPARFAPHETRALALVVAADPRPLPTAPIVAAADPREAVARVPPFFTQCRRRDGRRRCPPAAFDPDVRAVAHLPARLAP